LIYVSPVDTWNLKSWALNWIAALDNKEGKAAWTKHMWQVILVIFLNVAIRKKYFK
jgi:hypothetical protein